MYLCVEREREIERECVCVEREIYTENLERYREIE